MEQQLSFTQNNKFLEETFHNALVPAVLSVLSGNVTVLADGMIVGQKLGQDGLSAISFCLPMYLVLCVFGSWIVSGTAINAAKALGTGDSRKANRLCGQAMFFCLLSSVLLTVFGFLFLPQITAMLCSEAGLQNMVYAYAFATILGTAPKILLYIPFWYLRLDGKNKAITRMMLFLGLGNILLDLLFLYGFGWGIFGAGFASILATVLALCYGFWQLYGRPVNFRFEISVPDSGKEFLSMLSTGSPSATNNLIQVFRVLAVNMLLLSAGGSHLVAVFTAVNGISAFSECILSGMPQAAWAMLGSFEGEHDNGSIRLVIRTQLLKGWKFSLLFSGAVILGSGLLARAYGLEDSLLIPMICLSLSLPVALTSTVLINWYNIGARTQWANLLVVFRGLIFPVLSLWLLTAQNLSVWLFLPLGEAGGILVFFLLFAVFHLGRKENSFLLQLPEHVPGKLLCGSVEGDSSQICQLSSGILDFLQENGMDGKKALKMSLAAEELLVLIADTNESKKLYCDLRLLADKDNAMMTLRYSGESFNPLVKSQEEGEEYMGMRMLEKLMKNQEYQNISGMNVLRIQI